MDASGEGRGLSRQGPRSRPACERGERRAGKARRSRFEHRRALAVTQSPPCSHEPPTRERSWPARGDGAGRRRAGRRRAGRRRAAGGEHRRAGRPLHGPLKGKPLHGLLKGGGSGVAERETALSPVRHPQGPASFLDPARRRSPPQPPPPLPPPSTGRLFASPCPPTSALKQEPQAELHSFPPGLQPPPPPVPPFPPVW